MALAPLRWAPALEGPLLAALTLAASFGVYLAVRRVPGLRTVFGLNPARAPSAADSCRRCTRQRTVNGAW